MKTVKSANLHAVNDLRYEDTPLAPCGEDEVLVRVESCGVCGSDLGRVYSKGTYHFPTIIGHEFAGVVTEDSKNELTGKHVVVFPLLPCFECENCKKESYATCESYDYYGSRRDGGMTQALPVKRWNVLVMPESISFDEGAMCEPTSVARHAVRKLDIVKGDHVLISGAGPIGLIAGQWARAFGAAQVSYVDIDERKLEVAHSLGFHTYKEGTVIDCVLEGTGFSDALATCLAAVKPHGHVVLMGNPSRDVTLTQNTYWHILRKELKVAGTWNSSFNDTENDWKESLRAMAEGKIQVKPLITHTYPLSRCNEAFEMMKGKKELYNKVILKPQEEE